MTILTRRTLFVLVVALAFVPVIATAASPVTRYTFNDVTLTDADGTITGEIEASAKINNKRTTIYCGYFSDDYSASLGYYFDDSPVPQPTESDVLAFCLEEFPSRWR